MSRVLILCALPLFVGCEDVGDKIDAYTNPTVVEGLVLGVEEPTFEDFDFDLADTDFNKGAAAVVFLASATDVDEIESAPIEGAAVSLLSDTSGKLSMKDQGDGKYAVTGDDGLTYTAGESMDLSALIDGATAKATVTAPAAADADISQDHTTGSGLSVDLTGQAFDSVLVVVLDASSGDVTFSNQPDTVKEIYEFTHGGADSLAVDVPGTAFPSDSVYAVGVAGLKTAGEDDFTDANALLSAYMAGKMRFYPVSTLALPD